MSRRKKNPIVPPSPSRDLGKQVFAATMKSMELVKILEDPKEKPLELDLTPEQAEEVHLLLRSSTLGLLTVLSILSGHPDPREVILKGELP